jgi:hypothetical protein
MELVAFQVHHLAVLIKELKLHVKPSLDQMVNAGIQQQQLQKQIVKQEPVLYIQEQLTQIVIVSFLPLQMLLLKIVSQMELLV